MRKNFIIWLACILRVDLRPTIQIPMGKVNYVELTHPSIESIRLDERTNLYIEGERSDVSLQEARRHLCKRLAEELYKRTDLFHVYQTGRGSSRQRTTDGDLILKYKEFSGIIKILKHNETRNT